MEGKTLEPRVLLSWPIPPDRMPPPVFSSQQVTLCPRGKSTEFSNAPQDLIECPTTGYDVYEFVQQSPQIENKEFDLLVVLASSSETAVPINTKKIGCPTVLLAAATHEGSFPINYLLAYCAVEKFDYIVAPLSRQHLHWFAAAGFRNLAWLPLIHMYTVTHEWVETRENRVAFLDHEDTSHLRQLRLLNVLKETDIPLVTKSDSREQSAHLFAHSVISLNCSLNAEFSLRSLEIISAGGFLLTDYLSFAAGLDNYLSPGLYCDVYDSENDLVEKIKFYLSHRELALEIARRAYKKFFSDWHPRYRIADLMNWVFRGELPDFYAASADPRFFISNSYENLIGTRLAIYESTQELHRVEERLKVLVSRECPLAIVADLLDLPRVELYVESGFPISDLPHDDRILHRIKVLQEGLDSEDDWDVLITRLYKLDGQPVKSKFVFALGSDNQIEFSNVIGKLMNTGTLSIARQDGYVVNIRVYNNDPTVGEIVKEIFNEKSSYPIVDFVSDVKVILDIGANIGISSAYFRAFYQDAFIYCFELEPLAVHLLKINSLAIGNCCVYPVGLYSDDVTRVFYSGLQGTGRSSIHRSLCSDFAHLVRLRKASSFLEDIGVRRIDILKIDTEGCELQILRDLYSRLGDIKVIYLESHSEEDRRLIDQILSPTHVLWRGDIMDVHRANLCYLNRRYMPQAPSLDPLR